VAGESGPVHAGWLIAPATTKKAPRTRPTPGRHRPPLPQVRCGERSTRATVVRITLQARRPTWDYRHHAPPSFRAGTSSNPGDVNGVGRGPFYTTKGTPPTSSSWWHNLGGGGGGGTATRSSGLRPRSSRRTNWETCQRTFGGCVVAEQSRSSTSHSGRPGGPRTGGAFPAKRPESTPFCRKWGGPKLQRTNKPKYRRRAGLRAFCGPGIGFWARESTRS